MTCCTGDCRQGRDCPLRAKVAKHHPHKTPAPLIEPMVTPFSPPTDAWDVAITVITILIILISLGLSASALLSAYTYFFGA